ncbi:MAG: PG0541 family transporter-associated protein [Candidatus Eisenbacteria bacterium]|nr:hypothetical protein [Candidatus Eisenbacteria bacterium]
MEVLMIIVEQSHRERLEAALTERHVLGYTEIPTVFGMGRTGPRLGSRAFPESSSILFTVVEKGKTEELLTWIDESCSDCRERMRILVWSIDRML